MDGGVRGQEAEGEEEHAAKEDEETAENTKEEVGR